MLNIFIIDHRSVLRFGIRYLLERSLQDFQLLEFNSFEEVASGPEAMRPHLIIVGIDSELNGVQMLTELREMYQNSRLIVYDPNARNSDGIKYFRSGAHGYLSKNIDSAIFKNCVETVMDGKFYIDPRDLHMILERSINASKLVQDINNGIPRLTQRQGEIASCFAQGMSTSQIAKKLGLSSSTISTVKARIYEKLKIDNIVDLKEAMLY